MNIKGMDKAEVLAALFNAARPLGLGMLHFKPDHRMTAKEATGALAQGTYFDYLEGRVMKVDLSSDEEFNERLYDRDNGKGAAEQALKGLRR